MLYEGTGKRVVGYFVNWAVYNDYHQKQSPTDLPWDIMTHINYSFMQIENNKIASMDDWADTTGATDYGAPAMFEKVAMMKELYPDTKVLLSVGGWTRGDTFHEMVSSAANRKIFVDSVVEYLKKYPQFDGIDLDWEYPGTSPRAADHDDPNDRGCPTGTEADFENYTSIVTELRAALDANFSTTGQNIVTVCMPGDPNKIDRQNIVEITNACDFVNIMTYDYHGAFDPVGSVYENGVKTDKYWSLGYNSPLYSHEDTPNEWSTDLTVQYLLSKGIPAEKMNIGTPYYSRGWAGIPTITQDGMEVPAGIADKTPFDTPDKDYDHGSSNVAVSGITVTPETAALTVGGTTTATATVTPDNATDKTVTWTTDNRDVATVDANGVITAVAEGTATITAKTSNGLTDTCFVTVNAAQANQMYSIIKIGTTNAYNNFYGTFGLDQAPMVVDNKAYIPLRNATQLLYASIEDYNDATDEFYVVFSTFKAKMQIGSQKVDFYTPDGTYAFSDNLPEGQTPIIVDGKAYLPARQLATIASMDSGRQVEYISNSQGEYVAFIMGASATMSEVEAMVATAQGYIG